MEVKQKTRIGQVVSNKMDKTVVVSVESFRRHRLYKKLIRRVTKYKAHDADNSCQLGDKVRIVETRPLSKDKRWRVTEILIKGAVADVQPKEISVDLGNKENDSATE